jgi:hypothetical protein
VDWQPIPTLEGVYEVSNTGLVRRVSGRLMGQWKNSNGYPLVKLTCAARGIRADFLVHRLVAGTFIPNPENKPCVNHIDNKPANNRVENLEWCTQLENLQHADRQGRTQKDYWLGKRSPNASLSDEQVRQMRALYAAGAGSWETIGKMFGVSKRCAGRVITREVYADVQ